MPRLNDIDYLYSQALDNKPYYGGYANTLSFRDSRIKVFLNQLIETGMDITETNCISESVAGLIASRLGLKIETGVFSYPNNLEYEEWLTILHKIKDGCILIYRVDKALQDTNSPEFLLANEAISLLAEYLFNL